MAFQIRAHANAVDKHTSDVNTLIYYKGKLYSGGDDGKIIVWEKDLRKVTKIKAHETTVYCLAVSGGVLYSCSNDGTIKAWDLNDVKEKGTILQLENGEIYRLFANNGTLFSSDEQGVVRVHEGQAVKNIYNLLEPLKDVLVIGDFLYTVRDLDLVITKMKGRDNFEITKTLMGRAPLCVSGNYLCFASRNGMDILIHENSAKSGFKQVAEVKGAHEMMITALVGIRSGNDCLLYSAGWDKLLKLWKIENGACKLVNSCNVDMVVNVLTYGEKGAIYAGGSDGHIARVDVC